MTDTALFDLDDLTLPLLEQPTGRGYGPALTVYGRHHGLGPHVWDEFPVLCGAARYGALVDGGRRVWIWHACSTTGTHDVHGCDRCEVTW